LDFTVVALSPQLQFCKRLGEKVIHGFVNFVSAQAEVGGICTGSRGGDKPVSQPVV
jgi:hypothetical protein